jgi:flagellar biosynthesis/type III secretory pathway protein FliH
LQFAETNALALCEMASGNFFAPVEHDVDDALVHGFLNGGINDAFDFEFNKKNRKSPKYADVDFGTGRHNQSNQGSKGSTSKSLRGGGALSSRHVTFDLGKTSFIDPNPFEALDALMGGGSGSNESSSLDFSGGGRISNCASNPSYKWTPGQKTPQGLGFCPDDFKPGHVMRAYDGEYRVGVDRNGKKGWVPNSVPVHKYSNWDINPFTWPHHGIDHLLCCGNGVPKGTTLTATPDAVPTAEDVKKAQDAAAKAQQVAAELEAARKKATEDAAKTAAATAAAEADAKKKENQEKWNKVKAAFTELTKILEELGDSPSDDALTKFVTAVDKLGFVFGGGELVGGENEELKQQIINLANLEKRTRTNVISAIALKTFIYNRQVSVLFLDQYSLVLNAIVALAASLGYDPPGDIQEAIKELTDAFNVAEAKAAAEAAAKAAAEAAAKAAAEAAAKAAAETAAKAAAKTAATLITKANDERQKFETDLQHKIDKISIPKSESINEIKDEDLNKKVASLVQAAQVAKDAVIKNIKLIKPPTATDAEALKLSFAAVTAKGNAVDVGVTETIDIEMSVSFLKSLAQLCLTHGVENCKNLFATNIDKMKETFECPPPNSKKSVKQVCTIAQELFQILEQPAAAKPVTTATAQPQQQKQQPRSNSN